MAVTWKKYAKEDDVITKAFMAAKGDLISASADDTPLILTVGANTYVLTADSTEATGLKWAAIAGTVDTSGTPVANDFARFTDADTIEGREYSEVRTDLGLVIGTNVLAEQTIGIADNNLVEIDGADIATTELARFTATGLESRTPAEVAATMALDDVGVPDAAVDFDLQQATDLVVMTVANEAALPAASVAVGQLCFCTAELSLHICTVAA